MSTNMTAEQKEIRRLIQMMRHPRYWRDKEPAFVESVSEGFKVLYRQRMLQGAPVGMHRSPEARC